MPLEWRIPSGKPEVNVCVRSAGRAPGPPRLNKWVQQTVRLAPIVTARWAFQGVDAE